MRTYKIAIVGATGMVGQTFRQVLEDRKFPIKEIVFFASEKSDGKTIDFMGKTYLVKALNSHSFDEGFDIALFSAGGEISLIYAPIAASKGVKVIDNSSAWRMKPNIKLVVPEVNKSVLTKDDFIIANPNCSTIQSVVPLKVIHELFEVKRVIYSSYQAVSGSGYKGIMDLERGKNGEPNTFYPKPIYENVIPHIDSFLASGYTKEEQKMVDETKKILNLPNIKVSATCVRVPVLVGHSVSMYVETNKPIDLSLLNNTYEKNPDIVLHKDDTYPTPLDVAGQDSVHVGRVRLDQDEPNGLHLWVVADNVRKGAATNAIQIAEHLIKEDLV
ncbi:MAG: aspartate-semialdehyde dehydrogenase [Tenericutes bacterium HGW-Tenericutes-6]|jgi:aspartate-semialdehyde dehydrogenase|nr:MAG: aspartate-semialdehyde dehydrogenase [Tenericutes bacterium HGW-Tenericutes-6]